MTAQDLLDILNDKYEIPRPELANLCFYYTDDNNKEIILKIDSIGAFDISTDITFQFVEDKEPLLISPITAFKPSLREEYIPCELMRNNQCYIGSNEDFYLGEDNYWRFKGEWCCEYYNPESDCCRPK